MFLYRQFIPSNEMIKCIVINIKLWPTFIEAILFALLLLQLYWIVE